MVLVACMFIFYVASTVIAGEREDEYRRAHLEFKTAEAERIDAFNRADRGWQWYSGRENLR